MGLNMGPANANKYAFDNPTAVLNVSYVRGNHSFKIGADWRIDAYRNRNVVGTYGIYGFTPNETSIPGQQTASVGGGALGNAYASFLLGLANTASVSTPVDPQFRKMTWSLFVQDNWKVTRKLTINYGVRWDLQGAPDEIHQRIAEFSATTPNPAVGGLMGATVYEAPGPAGATASLLRLTRSRLARALVLPTRSLPRRSSAADGASPTAPLPTSIMSPVRSVVVPSATTRSPLWLPDSARPRRLSRRACPTPRRNSIRPR